MSFESQQRTRTWHQTVSIPTYGSASVGGAVNCLYFDGHEMTVRECDLLNANIRAED